MSQVAIIAKLSAQPGKRDELIAAFHGGLAHAETEPGTQQYILHEDAVDADVVWFYEMYVDKDAMAAHGGSDALKELGTSLRPLMAGRPELTFLNVVGGKGIPPVA